MNNNHLSQPLSALMDGLIKTQFTIDSRSQWLESELSACPLYKLVMFKENAGDPDQS
jgi:hypothetical protein